jgi:hypothetical protein
MKIRSSFVSNSSSSSFVLVGYEMTHEDIDPFLGTPANEEARPESWDVVANREEAAGKLGLDYVCGWNGNLIGEEVWREECTYDEVPLADIQKAIEKVKSRYGGQFGEPRLFVGHQST